MGPKTAIKRKPRTKRPVVLESTVPFVDIQQAAAAADDVRPPDPPKREQLTHPTFMSPSTIIPPDFELDRALQQSIKAQEEAELEEAIKKGSATDPPSDGQSIRIFLR